MCGGVGARQGSATRCVEGEMRKDDHEELSAACAVRVDLGTTKVAALIAEETGEQSPRHRRGSSASDGLRQGVVTDIERCRRVRGQAVGDADQDGGRRAEDVGTSGSAGEHVRSMNSRGVVTGREASSVGRSSPEDVMRALEAARKFSLPQDREIIHTLPQEFIVDSQRGIRQPAGMFGARLEARVHVVTASRPALDNLAKTLHARGHRDRRNRARSRWRRRRRSYRKKSAMQGPWCSTSAAARPTSSWLRTGRVVASGVIGLGGNNITQRCRLRPAHVAAREAERLKVEHGCALSTARVRADVVHSEQVAAAQGTASRDAPGAVSGIIEPRVTELFSLIDQQISSNGLKRSLRAGCRD